MSRIADAHDRAGVRPLGEEEQRWNSERGIAGRYLEIPKPKSESPHPKTGDERLELSGPRPETTDFELAAAMRQIFLAPNSTARSVMFCTMPGDRMSTVAWRAAEFIAAQSRQRVAFLQDGRRDRFPNTDSLVTGIGWYEPHASGGATYTEGEATPRAATPQAEAWGSDERVPEVKFPFVIVNATASQAEDLLALARQMDGVIAVISEGETRLAAARSLIATLRQTNLLGAIFVARH